MYAALRFRDLHPWIASSHQRIAKLVNVRKAKAPADLPGYWDRCWWPRVR
jgi:hypothetical protein